jgi:hypothetical protein
VKPEKEEGRENEEDISTLKREESQRSWFPKTDVDQSGQEDSEETQGQEENPVGRSGQ